jgi:hypothetical protein
MEGNITMRFKEMGWECIRTILDPKGKEVIKDER